MTDERAPAARRSTCGLKVVAFCRRASANRPGPRSEGCCAASGSGGAASARRLARCSSHVRRAPLMPLPVPLCLWPAGPTRGPLQQRTSAGFDFHPLSARAPAAWDPGASSGHCRVGSGASAGARVRPGPHSFLDLTRHYPALRRGPVDRVRPTPAGPPRSGLIRAPASCMLQSSAERTRSGRGADAERTRGCPGGTSTRHDERAKRIAMNAERMHSLNLCKRSRKRNA